MQPGGAQLHALHGTEPELTAFTREHLDGAIALFAAEGWHTYTADRERTYRSLVAPGSTTLVVLDGATVIALIQLQSDARPSALRRIARTWHAPLRQRDPRRCSPRCPIGPSPISREFSETGSRSARSPKTQRTGRASGAP